MKTLIAAAALIFSLSTAAQVNDEQERLNQEPPVTTERQVQNDAKKAAEVRAENDKLPDNSRQLKKQQTQDMRANKRDAARPPKSQPATTTNTNTSTTGKQ
jgi:hypothetical protein